MKRDLVIHKWPSIEGGANITISALKSFGFLQISPVLPEMLSLDGLSRWAL